MGPFRPLGALLLASHLLAQAPVFWRDANLVRGDSARDLGAALMALSAGPTDAQRALGFETALPRGATVAALRTKGDEVAIVFDESVLAVRGTGRVEDLIEQVTATARTIPSVRAVHIRVLASDGTEQELAPPPGAAPPRGPAPGPDSLVQGALTGRTIAISPGHGYYWHSSLGWTTQRGMIDGLIEDIHTNEIAIRHLLPCLENLGARVVHCRERGEIGSEALADNDQGAPFYSETGSWSTSSSAGYAGGTYRYAGTAPAATASATWEIPVPADGVYPVYAWFRAGSNRAPDARYAIDHDGGQEVVLVDQTRSDRTWEFLGEYRFTAAAGARVTLDNSSSAPGRVVIADAVRVGGGVGSIARGGSPSGRPRWQECARYWAQFAGAPSSVYDPLASGQDSDDDVTARPRYAEWRGADLFLSLHTNAGGGSGTDTYIHDSAPTPGSARLQALVQSQVVGDIRAEYDPSWVDRGTPSANFGELRLLSTMPGVLCELAFHDTPNSRDMRALHDPEFRRIAGRALARAVLRYFAPSAPFPPEPPTALRVTQDGASGLRVAYDPSPGATHYTIEQSTDGLGFAQVADVTGTSWSTGPFPPGTVLSFRVRAWNSSGRSLPTEVLCAGTDHRRTAEVLLVQGFDRRDRYVMEPENTYDYLRLHGEAIRAQARFSVGFDAATNEAVKLLRVGLAGYRAVDWALGEESTQHETFDPVEQLYVRSYCAGGGNLLVSGAEIAWDLDHLGTASDRDFCRNVLGIAYAADDAGTHALAAGTPGGLGEGIPAGTFDDGTHGTYGVDWPDVLAPADARGVVFARYGNGLAAGVQREDPVTGSRTAVLGLPIETIVEPEIRAAWMRRALRFLLAPLELEAEESVRIGQTIHLAIAMPTEAGLPYFVFTGLSTSPPISLPGGVVLPIADGFLLTAGLSGPPFFANFAGQLSGAGTAAASALVPPIPALAGLDPVFAAVSLSPAGLAARASDWARVLLVP